MWPPITARSCGVGSRTASSTRRSCALSASSGTNTALSEAAGLREWVSDSWRRCSWGAIELSSGNVRTWLRDREEAALADALAFREQPELLAYVVAEGAGGDAQCRGQLEVCARIITSPSRPMRQTRVVALVERVQALREVDLLLLLDAHAGRGSGRHRAIGREKFLKFGATVMDRPKTLLTFGKIGSRKVEADSWDALLKKPTALAPPAACAPFKPVLAAADTGAAKPRDSSLSLLTSKPLR